MTSCHPAKRVIALEEHFWDPAFVAHFTNFEAVRSPAMIERLQDFGSRRLGEMDEAGVSMQVISHGPPGGQRLKAEIAVEACRQVNDNLARAIRPHPDRFAAFAALPTVDPAAAADELQRCIEELGFKGAMIHGLSGGRFVDEPDFWPIYARAQALDVPIYLHPAMPHPVVVDTYYGTYAKRFPALIRAGWGFGIEAGTQAVRLVLSGVFDRCPELKILLGHLGEGIPFQLARIDEAFSRPGNEPIRFAEIFRRNFYVTTSGFFSDAALRCCIEEVGIGHILFAIDWPFVPNKPGMDWINAVDLPAEDKADILARNAERLLRL